MRRLRNKIMLSTGAVAAVAGIVVAVTPDVAHAQTIIINPIIGIINLLLTIGPL